MFAAEFRSICILPALILLNPVIFTANCQSPAGSITGAIFLAPDNQPARRVWVTVTAAPPSRNFGRTYTDSDGKFTIGGLPAGDYRVMAGGRGLQARTLGASSSNRLGRTISLAEGERREGITIVLARMGSVSGTTVDQEGEPVQARVNLLTSAFIRGKRSFRVVASAQADERGEFRLSNVNPGRYYLMGSIQFSPPSAGVGSQAVPLQRQQTTLFQSPMFRDSTTIEGSAPLELAPGQEISGITLRFPTVRAGSVAVRVNLPQGIPAQQQLSTELVPVGDAVPGASVIRGIGIRPDTHEGRIDDLMPGSYTVSSTLEVGQEAYSASETISVTPGMTTEVSLTLNKAIDLPAMVTVEGPQAEKYQRFQVGLVAPYGGTRGLRHRPGTEAIAGKAFRLPRVVPGVWDISVSPIPPGGYLKSIKLGDRDVLTEEMRIDSQTSETLRMVVHTQGGTVEGEAAGSELAWILLAPEGRYERVWSFYRVTPSGPKGQFRFTGLTPGTYRVMAFEDISPDTVIDPEVWKPYARYGVSVTVKEGESQRVKLERIPAGARP